ncbi:MAG: hypothetical protein JWN84_3373 [Nocardioides sp.]|jgi:uncharacterized membrane protein|nr:hypothetical protein [Nocardioides sp.]
MDPGTASAAITRWGRVGLGLLLAGALLLAVGWPRRLACDDDTVCDGSSGHEVFVWIGAALVVASLYPLMVHATARGAGLRAAAERDEDTAG